MNDIKKIARDVLNHKIPPLKGIIILHDNMSILPVDEDLKNRITGVFSQIDHLAYFVMSEDATKTQKISTEIDQCSEYFFESIVSVCMDIKNLSTEKKNRNTEEYLK